MKHLLLTTAFVAFGTASHAATLLEFETDSSTTNATLSSSTVGAGITANDLTAGSGLVANVGGTWNWRDWTAVGTVNTSASDAIATGHFWTWGFSSTQQYDLDSFDIRLDRSGTGPNQFDIGVSVNGGALTSVLSDNFGTTSSGRNYLNVDLSRYTNVTSIDFTLAAFGADSGGATSAGTLDLETIVGGGRSDAFQLRGEISPIPLPAGMPLLMGGLAGLLSLRRRK